MGWSSKLCCDVIGAVLLQKLWSYELSKIIQRKWGIKKKTAKIGARHNAKYLRVVGGESGELVSQVSRKTDKLRTAQKLPSRRQGFDSMANNTANSRRRWLSETELTATFQPNGWEVCWPVMWVVWQMMTIYDGLIGVSSCQFTFRNRSSSDRYWYGHEKAMDKLLTLCKGVFIKFTCSSLLLPCLFRMLR